MCIQVLYSAAARLQEIADSKQNTHLLSVRTKNRLIHKKWSNRQKKWLDLQQKRFDRGKKNPLSYRTVRLHIVESHKKLSH